MKRNSHNFIRSYLVISTLLSISSSYVHALFDITLESIEDSEHKLSQYIGQGKWVVLNIWCTRCPPCREEMP